MPASTLRLLCLCFIHFAINGCELGSAEPPHEGYKPLAEVTIALTPANSREIYPALQTYCVQAGCQAMTGEFPRRDRSVLQVEMRFESDVVFLGSNFIDAEKFSIVGYSHAPEAEWKPKWSALVKHLKSKFGNSEVSTD